jgi:hypothetical protein
MTEGNMTGRPYGGANEATGQNPGEREEHDLVGPPSEQEEPRAAQGGTMGTAHPSAPGSDGQPRPADPPPGDTGG